MKGSQLKFEKMVTKRDSRETKDEMFTLIHFINGLKCCHNITCCCCCWRKWFNDWDFTICVYILYFIALFLLTLSFKKEFKKVRAIVLQLATARVIRVRETHQLLSNISSVFKSSSYSFTKRESSLLSLYFKIESWFRFVQYITNERLQTNNNNNKRRQVPS